MRSNLKIERSNYLIKHINVLKDKNVLKILKDAPLMIRRMGLPMAIAYWAKDGDQKLTKLISNWIFQEWKMISGKIPPQKIEPFLQELKNIDRDSVMLRSAIEVETELLLQTAKIIAEAVDEEKK
ncbi:hypothetical protein K8T06_14275 [bacterium]|nr:hypothetical protein [bacterium]